MMEMITTTDAVCSKISKKPPLPPTKTTKIPQKSNTDKSKTQSQLKMDEENVQQVQKLTALNEKLNLEIADTKKQLFHERCAVRELRAAHDSEYRKLKNETKKLLEVIGNVKKSAVNNTNKYKAELCKVTEEVTALKDAKNALEKKLKNCNCPSGAAAAATVSSMVTTKGNKTTSTFNEQTKIDQITATAKAEIQRLLEELKSKEREISSIKKRLKKNESQMRAATTQKIIDNSDCQMEEKSQESQVTTTCTEPKSERYVTHVDLSEPMHHQSEESAFKTFIKMENSSSDSNTITLHRDMRTSNATTIIEVKESQEPMIMQGLCSSLSSTKVCNSEPNDNLSLDMLQKKYDQMTKELTDSHKRIEELEKSLEEQNNNTMTNDRVQDRMKYLEEREKRLEKESHELREQNELLEFRILELEENQDKWSLRSNLTPDSKDTCSCWREKETDDLMMMTMSSDSGITSPNSHHLDDHQSVSPCSISLMDQLPTDDMRAHILKMSKRSFYNDDDKLCFSQMLMLLNSLEALSHDQSIIGEDYSSMEYSMDKIKSSPLKIPEPILPPSIQNFSNHQQSQLIPPSSSQPKHQKIIATVQPYSTTQHTKAIAEPKKESTDEHNNSHQMSQETQTEAVDDAYNKTNAELYAEIEKLNRFRKKVEESSSSLSKNSAQVMSTGFDAIERRHLKFYEERMKMLESKLQVYEASGDEQVKILSKRLEREVQLESRLNVLEDSLMRMEEKNMELEEQNCELEEIENETRLRWQKLEEDYEVMTQRNSELEMSKMTYQEKYEEARDSVEYLEECLQGSEERIKALEVNLKELKRRLAMSQAFIPAVALFQMWRLKKITMPLMITSPKPDHIEVPADHPIHKKLLECQARERQLTQNINDLNRAYQETLENADNLWAQMEKEYKDKIAHYEKMEVSLRSKIQTLERRLIKDTEDAHERIAALEENEYQLKNRAGKLSRELKEQQKKNSELYEELSNSKDEYQKLQAYINGPLADALEKEKRKLRRAEEDLTVVRNALKENETAHKNEQNLLKRQLQKMHKELKNFEVTNGELKEEVETLERRIIELESYRVGDKNRIQELIDELETKAHVHEHNKPLRPLRNNNAQVRSLAQELNQKPMIMPRQKTVIPIERSAFADVIEKFESHNFDGKREIKSLADSIISNAENNGFVPVKRSFVEEARQKFAKWV